MEHMFVFKSRNWHGCDLFIQSLFLLSRYNHFSLKAFAFIPRCAEILVISALVYVGLITLQQFAQFRQLTSDQTSFSVLCRISCRFSGGFLSILLIKYRKDLRFRSNFFFNSFKSMDSMGRKMKGKNC